MQIGYVKNKDMPTTINLRVDKLRGEYYDEKGKHDMMKCRELFKEGKTRSEISAILDINISSVYRYLNNNYSPFETSARYFSDIVRDKNWFKEL